MKIVCNKRWGGGGFFSNGYHRAQVPLKSFRPSVIEVVHWAKGYVKLNEQFIKKKKKKERKDVMRWVTLKNIYLLVPLEICLHCGLSIFTSVNKVEFPF